MTTVLVTRLSKCVVSNQYDTKRHMCLKNDTTQHKNFKFCFLKFQNFSKPFQNFVCWKINPHCVRSKSILLRIICRRDFSPLQMPHLCQCMWLWLGNYHSDSDRSESRATTIYCNLILSSSYSMMCKQLFCMCYIYLL